MLVVEVDHVHAEAGQARVARFAHVLGPAVDEVGPRRIACLPELGGENRLIAAAAQRAPQQRLVVAPAVHVRRVDMGDPPIQRVLDEGDGGRIVGGAVDAGE
jgi:hypothetical protein